MFSFPTVTAHPTRPGNPRTYANEAEKEKQILSKCKGAGDSGPSCARAASRGHLRGVLSKGHTQGAQSAAPRLHHLSPALRREVAERCRAPGDAPGPDPDAPGRKPAGRSPPSAGAPWDGAGWGAGGGGLDPLFTGGLCYSEQQCVRTHGLPPRASRRPEGGVSQGQGRLNTTCPDVFPSRIQTGLRQRSG